MATYMMAKLISSSGLKSGAGEYLLSLACTSSGCAVIGSDNTLRLFDPSTLQLQHAFEQCNAGVERLTSATTGAILYTAGRDGLLRAWDVRSRSRVAEVKEPRQTGISAIASTHHYVAAGTESTKEGLSDVSVHIFDMRQPQQPVRSYNESHTDTVTDLAWHPKQNNLLMSGSTDGLVSIFDTNQADEEDAIQQVLNPRSAVHCSGFINDDQAYVLSTDEHFSVYGLNKTGTTDEEALPVTQYGDVRSKLDCMYVVKLLQGYEHGSWMMAHGNNDKSTLNVTYLNESQSSFGRTIALPSAHGEEVVRDVQFWNVETLLSCGEDGQVKTWRIPGPRTAPTPAKKKSKKGKSARYQPY